ncbi:hypothetical protein [Antrihabitans sp. YC2-6]|uniref:hypothetical protein n=1 Tax=Antrihabitans sp. YC2-6 TaxID=2799498 RepID=UPI0018F7C859|nr:hypothetical protein [Antrihabitans sp. YC2-6]MBJ8346183.1 hypothetical protein [Antrihabitans sp. YC2-6]
MELAILVLLLILALAILGALGVLIVSVRQSAQRATPRPSPAIVQSARNIGRGRIITIEILNPLEVASGQSWFAGIASSLAPSLVTKTVYDTAAKMMRQELAAAGVEAVVDVAMTTATPQTAVAPPMGMASGE